MILKDELLKVVSDAAKKAIPKDTFIIDLFRDSFFEEKTLGKLYFEDKVNEFSQTLEDKVRLPVNGIITKVAGETAIFEGIHKVKMTYSPRFKKKMPLIYNMDDLTLKGFGISFSGLRFHGGNDEDDTEGCPLTCKYRTKENDIKGSLSKEVRAKIIELEKKYKYIYLNVKNLNNQSFKEYCLKN
jgi:hypothetical protein